MSPAPLPIPLEFVLFGLTLVGIALLHRYTLQAALTGLVSGSRWPIVLSAHRVCVAPADHFYESRVPVELPRLLPGDWKGAFVLLLIVFVLSAFLDNIAAGLVSAVFDNIPLTALALEQGGYD